MRAKGPAIVIFVAVLALCVDLVRPVESQVTTRLALAGIDLYQATISKVLGRAGARCRFTPSCSHYGEAVIRKHGAVKGGWMAIKRIFRCGPWTPMGTNDPPPGDESRVGPQPELDQPEPDQTEPQKPSR